MKISDSIKIIHKRTNTKQSSNALKERNLLSFNITKEKAPPKKKCQRKDHRIHTPGLFPLKGNQIKSSPCKSTARTVFLKKYPAWTGCPQKGGGKQQIHCCRPDSNFVIIPVFFYSLLHNILILFLKCYAFSLSNSPNFLPMKTPITEAIISPLVQPLESPRQYRPFTFVSKSVVIFTLLL